MTAVTLGSQIRRTVGAQEVSFKPIWAQEWSVAADLHAHCLEATWALSPTMPTATIDWEYGWIQQERRPYYSQIGKLNCLNWYVRIRVPLHSDALVYKTWYGIVNHVEDTNQGIVTVDGIPLATGKQLIHCYGLEKLLDTELIAESWVDRGEESAETVQLPIDFNARGIPNRNDRPIMPEWSYVFEGQVLSPGGTLRPTAQWWSTKEIVRYLLTWAIPRDSFRTRRKRLTIDLVDPRNLLSVNDHPTLHQDGQTVLSLLHRLIDRRRLRSFYLDVDSDTDHIQLKPIAWNKNIIDPQLDNIDPLLENRDTIQLNYDQSQCAASVLRKTRVSRYDRVIARGARRTSTATFYVDAACLVPAWTTAEETAYEEAFSNDAGYAALDDINKKKRNKEVRGHAELSAVYSWFKLPDDWSGTIGEVESAYTHSVFVDVLGDMVAQDIHEVVFESYIPLYEHVDYSIIADADDPPVRSYRQPYLVFVIPTDDRYISGDVIATLGDTTADPAVDGANFRWSARCRPQQDTRTIEINVQGEQQYVIADTDFTPLAADRNLGAFDYRDKGMLVTLALRDNRRAEGKYPVDGSGDTPDLDTQYGFIIHAGEEYRQDYLVPGTVVDINDAGAVIKTNGGFIRDDTKLLELLARIAYEWWSQDRMILSLTTTDLSPLLDIGVMIETIGDSVMPGNEHYEMVNTVISEVRIHWPRLADGTLELPTMDIITGAGELDPMTIVPAPVSRERGSRSLIRTRAAMSARR